MAHFAAPTLLAAALFVVVACGNSDTTPQPTAPTATYAGYPQGYPPPGYPPPGQPPGYATAPPPGYPPQPSPYPPQPQPSPYPQPAPTVAPTAPPSGGQLSAPGMLAMPCQNDGACGMHHCNTQYGKCTFPCQVPTDCTTNNCVVGVCLPGGGS
jgi:hypothetical protein